MKKLLVLSLAIFIMVMGCEVVEDVSTSSSSDSQISSVSEDIVNTRIDEIISSYLENHASDDLNNYVNITILSHLGKLDEFISVERFNENINASSIEEITSIGNAYKYSIILSAFDQDLSSFDGVSLVEKTASLNEIGKYQSLYGLMALNNYKGEKSESVQAYFDALIEDLTKVNTPKVATPDLGGTTLIALAPYYQNDDVKAVIDEYVNWISEEVQLENGAIPDTYMGENAATIAQVIMGLVANNIDPRSEEFTKGDNDLITALLEYALDDGSFKYQMENDSSDLMFSTPQAVLALVVYQQFVKLNQAVNAFIV